MNNFFPTEDYKMPTASNYMKFIEGENPFRVLSSAVIGYQYFTEDNKPVRQREAFDVVPSNIKKDGRINHFWAFAVFNINENKIQILEITQKTIMATMESYVKNPKWGNPREYDFIVTRKGSGMDTEYTVSVNPKEPISQSIVDKCKSMNLNLETLYSGSDPFASKEDMRVVEEDRNITMEKIDDAFNNFGK